jgi:acyl-coenzyme A thioesterase PaaI-like protein
MALRVSPGLFRHVMNFWPPFRGAGIRVREIAPDWRHVRAELRPRLLNRNFVGTHFGGSLFAMTDPFYMLMLLHTLGNDYLVWDQQAEIEYLKPGRGVVSAEFRLEAAELERLRHDVAGGAKLLPEFSVEIRDAAGELVARVRKRIYVRLKVRARPATAGT